MGNPTRIGIEDSEPPDEAGPKGVPTTAMVAGRDRRGSRRPSEVEPTGVLTGVLGELSFYYGACCIYHSASRRGKTR